MQRFRLARDALSVHAAQVKTLKRRLASASLVKAPTLSTQRIVLLARQQLDNMLRVAIVQRRLYV